MLASVEKCYAMSLGKQFLIFQRMEVPPRSGSTSSSRLTTQDNIINCIHMDNVVSKREMTLLVICKGRSLSVLAGKYAACSAGQG